MTPLLLKWLVHALLVVAAVGSIPLQREDIMWSSLIIAFVVVGIRRLVLRHFPAEAGDEEGNG
ncbi:hypothetical protein [Streptomyces sp. NPDC060198]|uniref:hypothetical protein n=1 Tax=Streptomyces sp. NPDC060198 TaxID=3347070 RepID=UPI00365F724C